MHVACPAPWGRAFGASPLHWGSPLPRSVEEATHSCCFALYDCLQCPRPTRARTCAGRSHFLDFSRRGIVGVFVLAHQWPKLMVLASGLRRPSSPWTCVEVGVRRSISASGCHSKRVAYRPRWGYPSVESVVREGRTYTSLRDVADVTVSRRRMFFRSTCGSRGDWDPDCS